MPALPSVPTVQLWHSEVPTLAKVILPDAAQRVDHGPRGSWTTKPPRCNVNFPFADNP